MMVKISLLLIKLNKIKIHKKISDKSFMSKRDNLEVFMKSFRPWCLLLASFQALACGSSRNAEESGTSSVALSAVSDWALPDAPVAPPKPVAQHAVKYTGADGKIYEAIVFEPIAYGKYPLFVWVPGTNEAYDSPVALRIARTMAERGTVAVTAAYNNTFAGPWSCDSFDARAKAFFDVKRRGSLLQVISTGSFGINLSKGILVAGHSLGAWVAGRAADVAPQVRAAWLLSVGYQAFGGGMNLCLKASQTALQKIRAVNGVHDSVYGGTEALNLEQVQQVTGICIGCSATVSFDASGVGYALVQDADVQVSTPTATAEHFYFLVAPKMTPQPDWDATTKPWGRLANEQWLMDQLKP